MDVSALSQQVALGAAGGVAAEVLHWYSLTRRPADFKKFKAGVVYWMATLGMIGLGGLMPFLYLSGTASALLCFHLGAATPVLLQKLMSSGPSLANAQGAAPGLRDFFRW